MQIQAENLAYWYLRLNGFLTITNFVVHPDQGDNQETDVDLLAVRFPYRSENLSQPMTDDQCFTRVNDKPFIALVEVKTKMCDLNGPWTNPDRQNMLRVLSALGALPQEEVVTAAEALYKEGVYSSQIYYVSLVCLGAEKNTAILGQFPNVVQVLWPDVLKFIYERFQKYRRQKISHGQWDEHGRKLWDLSESSASLEEFIKQVKVG